MTTFSAKHWINANCFGGDTLRPETIDVISNFTLMWNLFEGVICDNHANIRAFEKIAESIAQRASLSAEIEDGVRFWSARYFTSAGFNDLFQGCTFAQGTAGSKLKQSSAAKKMIPEANS